MTAVKICGISDAAGLAAAQEAGAQYAGFVFFEKSPRNVTPDTASGLMRQWPGTSVALFVDPDDDTLRRVTQTCKPGMIQLHGQETPARVAAVKSLTGVSVMKAVRIAAREDLAAVADYAPVADWLLFDAKASGASLPGGTGQAFDWSVLDGFTPPCPWMLAGGLTPENVGTALKTLKPPTAPHAVDVSSGVESTPGVKDPCKIAAFVEAVRHAQLA